MSKQAAIPFINHAPDWSAVPALPIDCDPWHSGYNPHARAQAVMVKDVGLMVRLCCDEARPFAVETDEDSPVYQDSCLECFINFRPTDAACGYLNFEVNANGAMLSEYGLSRAPRTWLRLADVARPKVTLTRQAKGWSVAYTIGMDIITHYYGITAFHPGDSLRANFFKCCSRAEPEHYLSWSPIDAPMPDFHRPEYFGTLALTEADGGAL